LAEGEPECQQHGGDRAQEVVPLAVHDHALEVAVDRLTCQRNLDSGDRYLATSVSTVVETSSAAFS